MKRDYVVYGLLFPCPPPFVTGGLIGYVGITTRPIHERLEEHIADHPEWRVKPVSIELERAEWTHKEAQERERWWIWKYASLGHPVLNKKHLPDQGRSDFIFHLRRNWQDFN